MVGPAGREIFTDKYGRVKLRFYWDREIPVDDTASAWIRAGALHPGRELGYLTVPRIGQEVIVDFLEGAPDQPIIVGPVHNAYHLPRPEQ